MSESYKWYFVVFVLVVFAGAVYVQYELNSLKTEVKLYPQQDSALNAKIDSLNGYINDLEADIRFNEFQRDQNRNEVEESKGRVSNNNTKLKKREKEILQNPVDSGRVDNVKRYLQQRIKSRQNLP